MEKNEAIVLLELMGWRLRNNFPMRSLYTINGAYPHVYLNRYKAVSIGRIVTKNTRLYFDSYTSLIAHLKNIK